MFCALSAQTEEHPLFCLKNSMSNRSHILRNAFQLYSNVFFLTRAFRTKPMRQGDLFMTTVKQYSYLYEFCARDRQTQMCGTQHFKEITTKTNSLPSTINAADWLTFPSKFVPVHVYSPASARVTRCTTSLPSGLSRARFFQPELSESNHVIVGDGFPVEEHWNSAFWFSLTVNTLGEIATVGIEIDSPGSPFAPGKTPGTWIPLDATFSFLTGWTGGSLLPVWPGMPCVTTCTVSSRGSAQTSSAT